VNSTNLVVEQAGEAQRVQGGLHPAQQRAALQDLLLQGLEVVDVAHGVAPVAAGEGAVGGLALQSTGVCRETGETDGGNGGTNTGYRPARRIQ